MFFVEGLDMSNFCSPEWNLDWNKCLEWVFTRGGGCGLRIGLVDGVIECRVMLSRLFWR